MEQFLSRLESAADRGRVVHFVTASGSEDVPWRRLLDDARMLATTMQSRGVGWGERVALLGVTSRQLITAIEATWLSGCAVIVLPLPVRAASPEEYAAQTRTRIQLGDVSLVAGDPELLALLGGEPGVPALSFDELMGSSAGEATYARPPEDDDATAILQFTSGSTSDPKGVVIPRRCVLDNIRAIGERVPLDGDDDVMVSWLPQYHDMGLVANTAYAMLSGAEYVIAQPQHFMSSPSSWMELMSAYRGTWSLGPNFALAIAGRVLAHAGEQDLSSIRCLGSGSEPVDASVMDSFAAAGSRHQLDSRALFAAYGMAEATVCISVPRRGSGFTTDVVDAEVLEYELHARPVADDDSRGRRLARCGPPLSGMEMRIIDPETGGPSEDRVLGEIEIRGPSVVPGYFKRPDATAALFRDGGWLRTGDLGYLADGDVVVAGRLKDVMVVGGRNVFPEDVERAVQDVDGIRKGNVIAFGVAGGRKGDEVVLVAEVKGDVLARIRDDAASAVLSSVGVRLHDVVLLPPGMLPKTSSGKLRRSVCRGRYLSGELVGP